MKHLRISIRLPDGLGATSPRIEGGELLPTVHFDADQAYDIGYQEKPTRFAIGDAIAVAALVVDMISCKISKVLHLSTPSLCRLKSWLGLAACQPVSRLCFWASPSGQ